MQRYALFGGLRSDGAKGWEDFRGFFDEVELPSRVGINFMDADNDWWHVVDLESRKIVASGILG